MGKSEDQMKQVIPIDDVYTEERISAGKRKIPITTVGFYLALCVLGYLVLVTLFLIVDYCIHSPETPKVDAAKEAIETYQTLSQIVTQRAINFFELMITKTMIPVLTAILGYIFGVRESQAKGDENDEE